MAFHRFGMWCRCCFFCGRRRVCLPCRPCCRPVRKRWKNVVSTWKNWQDGSRRISREREGRMENRLAELQERCETLNRENKGLAADKADGGKGIGVGARTDGARGRRAQPPFQGTDGPSCRSSCRMPPVRFWGSAPVSFRSRTRCR